MANATDKVLCDMKIHIAHITLSMGTGGQEKVIVDLVRHMDKDKYKFTIGCIDSGGDLLSQIEQDGHNNFITGRKPGFDVSLIFKLVKLFKQNHVHIVHTHNQAAHFYAGIAAKLARVPVLITTEHSRHNTDKYLRRKIEKLFLYLLTDQWVFVSNEMAEKSLKVDRLPLKKSSTINNGIDIDKYNKTQHSIKRKNRLLSELKITDNEFIIIMVARLHPIKNHSLLLKAFALIKHTIPRVRLLLVGDGECRRDLEILAGQLNIIGNIDFLGVRDDVSDILSISNLFVLCSKSEGLPLSLLEASAAGVPVIITKSANKSGYIKHLYNGIEVFGSAQSIADGITYTINNRELTCDMAAKNYTIVDKMFSLKLMLKQYRKLYNNLLNRKF